MATTAHPTFPPHDRAPPLASTNAPISTSHHKNLPHDPHLDVSHPGQHLDDADILAWKRQYATTANIRDQNALSNSTEDLTQLIAHAPYSPDTFAHDFNDTVDDEIHFDDGAGYDYVTAIQDRLKKANEELKNDETPTVLNHHQRVSFDAVVKAVDIVQDPKEYENVDSTSKPPISPVDEEPSTPVPIDDETDGHQYTEPLNDTKPREGPTLLQQLRSMQFHGAPPPASYRTSTSSNAASEAVSNGAPSKSGSHSNNDAEESHGTMVVARDDKFEILEEDDYRARRSLNGSPKTDKHPTEENPSAISALASTSFATSNGKDEDQTSENRTNQRLARPKSSEPIKQTKNMTSTTTEPLSIGQSKSDGSNQARAKSAGSLRSTTSTSNKSLGAEYFNELNRKAAEKRLAELREEQRKREREEKERQKILADAKDSYDEWVRKKDAERKRLKEEQRLESEEKEIQEKESLQKHQEECEKKFQEWIERKNKEKALADEFRSLQQNDYPTSVSGSSSSVSQNDVAFRRWLRRKYQQSKQERLNIQREQRRLRRHQRRSIKRFQLLQDLQLAKSFGYS